MDDQPDSTPEPASAEETAETVDPEPERPLSFTERFLRDRLRNRTNPLSILSSFEDNNPFLRPGGVETLRRSTLVTAPAEIE